jgi:hypothetical protein
LIILVIAILFKLKGFQNFPKFFLHGHLVSRSIPSKWILTYNIIKVNISISKKKSIITLCTTIVAFGLPASFPLWPSDSYEEIL